MAFNKEDCHGIYLIFYNSIKENIKSKDELLTILRESGRNVGSDLISKYWKSREINYEEYIKICQEVPIITKTDLIKALKMMDTNKYGYLEKSEFIRTMSTSESPLSRKDILEIIKRIDVKDDGKLQFEVVADLLLSNLESFKKLGRSKIAEKEGKSPTKSVQEVAQHRKSQSNSNRNSLSITEEDEDEDDIVLSSRKSSDRKSENEIHIEKITSARFEYTEPKTLKNWRKTILRGCLFLGDISSSNSVQDPNIESHLYKFTVNTATNVFIMMSPLTILQKLDLREVPDLGFVILNKSEEIVALSMPADASGAVYFSGNLNAGSYNVLPFTTGAKLKSKANEAKDNFSNLRPLKKDSNGDYEFSNEVKTMLEDIFKICDIDGNGYLNKEEFIWYSTKTSEDDWEEDMWTELKSHVKLHNGELSFTNFTDLIMEEIMQENGDPAPLLLTLDLFGFNEKCMIEEAFPFSMTFYVENSDYLAKCFGIHNKTILVESSLKNFVVTQGEKLSGKVNWKDCNVYMSCRNGRILVAVENTNPASKQIPVRLTINMEKSKNLAVYKDKFQRNVSIDTGTKLLAVHGVPIEPKVPISCDCFIRRS